MDDNTQTVQVFHTGEDGRIPVRVTRPTPEQAFVLSLTRAGKTPDENRRAVSRLVRILEALIGTEQWDGLVEQGLIDGTLSVTHLLDLASRIFRHDWSAVTDRPVPGDRFAETAQEYESRIADALTGDA